MLIVAALTQNTTLPVASVSYDPSLGYVYVEDLGCLYNCFYGECCGHDVSFDSDLAEARGHFHSITQGFNSLLGRREPTKTTENDGCECEQQTLDVLSYLPLCTLQSDSCCNSFGTCGNLYDSPPLGGYIVVSYCLSGETPLYMGINSTDPSYAYPDDLVSYRLNFENYQATVNPSIFNAPKTCVCQQ